MNKEVSNFINESRIGLNFYTEDKDVAIREAGKLLYEDGIIEERYIDAMVATCNEFDSYIVLVPGVAMPHARPDQGAKKMGFSFLQLAKPVVFGHPENDPVKLVIAVSAVDSESHMSMLYALLELVSNSKIAKELAEAKDKKTIMNIFENAIKK